MENKKEKYIDNSGDRKYFAMIPYYIINHSSAYEQSLYLVMKRIASEEGTCWASAITIGKIMGVSANTVRKYRDKLINRDWIKCIGKRGTTKPTYEFEIVDLWKLNMDYYAKKESSTGELSKKKVQPVSEIVQPVSLVSSTGCNKEETYKKNKEEDISKAVGFAGKDINNLIELFKEVNPNYEILFKNKTQRAAIERMVSKFGREKVENAIKVLPQIINKPYAPRITTPIQLENKLGELKAFYEQEKSKVGKNQSKVGIIQ